MLAVHACGNFQDEIGDTYHPLTHILELMVSLNTRSLAVP
jgi:hypothetical protein